jgi:hypothetical protein
MGKRTEKQRNIEITMSLSLLPNDTLNIIIIASIRSHKEEQKLTCRNPQLSLGNCILALLAFGSTRGGMFDVVVGPRWLLLLFVVVEVVVVVVVGGFGFSFGGHGVKEEVVVVLSNEQ